MQQPVIRLSAVVALLFTFFCSPPTETEKDLLEMERVWQYCKIYSIWQEFIPDDPVSVYDYPGEIVDGLPDSLHSDTVHYSMYWPSGTVPPGLFAGSGFTGSAGQAYGLPVYYAQLTDKTLYIRIKEFSEYSNESGQTVSTFSLLQAIPASSPNVIVDLRSNGGGNIDICTLSIDLFLEKDIPYIGAIYRKNVKEIGDTGWAYDTLSDAWKATKTGDRFEGKNIVVLTDCHTASAAEIFAAGLRDGVPGAQLYGTVTFGKGIGQYIFSLASGAAIKLTGFKFERAGGEEISRQYNKKGITPDMPKQTVVKRNGLFWVDSLIIAAGEKLEPGFENNYDRAIMSDLARNNDRFSESCSLFGAAKFLRPEDLPVY
ncbi:MAG: hypothetical protein GF401_13140 [Chitinivibrionales bacterium]|nr:hypothetical protein [Chitinivibrionales bacterium]